MELPAIVVVVVPDIYMLDLPELPGPGALSVQEGEQPEDSLDGSEVVELQTL
jgi:hypothetical protein